MNLPHNYNFSFRRKQSKQGAPICQKHLYFKDTYHTGSVQDEIDFLHSSPYSAVFWICTKAATAQQYFSYGWTLLAKYQGLFCFSLCSPSQQARHGQEFGRRHSQDSWSIIDNFTILSITIDNFINGKKF